MRKDSVETILKEFRDKRGLYEDFTKNIEALTKGLLSIKGIRVHSISSRTKEETSLKNKVDRPGGGYSTLNDVTDITGVRVITFFDDDVDAIAEVIEKEFVIDVENSVDKRKLMDPDRFGYLSLHYVAKLSAARLQLSEYKRFSDCKFEIQIRSILQHTWAEIEHDLGYKSKQAIPKEVQRRFFRLAGLLEIADNEFDKIRDDLAKYEEDVSRKITETPASVLINQASLLAFIKSNSRVRDINQKIASFADARVGEDVEDPGRIVDQLYYVGVETIADIDNKLKELGDIVARFAQESLAGSQSEEVSIGISLFYLCYVMTARTGSTTEISDYLERFSLGIPDERKSIADKIISIYEKVISESK